ncbi:MAG: hypothetical protein IPM56_06440 [Ignavibacteriales bacterium]|nr:MAG: hypothetical protein IPM56_06440 [Ignavibacteriales bacterium]
MNSPFLVQFKKQRSNEILLNSIELKYDSQLNYNILESKNDIELLTMTKTSVVKSEQPDEDSETLSKDKLNRLYSQTKIITEVKTEKSENLVEDLSSSQLNKLYLQTKTITRVKSEQPDEIEDSLFQLLLSTQTFTKAIGEGSDED